MTYRVTAYTEPPWRVLVIFDAQGLELGATQSYGRHDAEFMVRDWLRVMDHADSHTAELEWTWEDGPAPQDDDD